jgi:hypothetical protein
MVLSPWGRIGIRVEREETEEGEGGGGRVKGKKEKGRGEKSGERREGTGERRVESGKEREISCHFFLLIKLSISPIRLGPSLMMSFKLNCSPKSSVSKIRSSISVFEGIQFIHNAY